MKALCFCIFYYFMSDQLRALWVEVVHTNTGAMVQRYTATAAAAEAVTQLVLATTFEVMKIAPTE